MRVGLLGPLKVDIVEGPADVRAPQQRVLIATLAVHVGCVVHSEQLATAIWGDPPPARWRQALPPLIRRLRVSLGADDGRILTSSPGYRLDVEPRRIDIWAFDALRKDGLAAALADDWEQASRILTEAENLWRGTPFGDIESAELRDAWQQYLEDQYRDVRETRLEADVRLSLRTARSAVAELRKMVAADPASERLRWLLMLALQRSGKQADAQAAFRDAWAYSTSELASRPGPALQSLNRRIIAADPDLLSLPFKDTTPPAT
jgi:DNA-binding SARP family transcriptional activator